MATYTTDADTLANTQQMLGTELADRVNDISYDTDPDALQDAQRDPRPTAPTDVQGDVGDVPGPRAPAAPSARLSMLEQNLHFRATDESAHGPRRDAAHRDWRPPPRTRTSTARHFGKELTRWFVAPLLSEDEQRWAEEHDIDCGMTGASMLAFMMRDVDYGPELPQGRRRRARPTSRSSPRTAPMGARRTGTATTATARSTRARRSRHADPMAEMMRAMSRQPEVGLRVHPRGGQRRLLLRQARLEQRRVRRHLGARRPGQHRPRQSDERPTPREAAMIASQFVDWTADSRRLQHRGRQGRPPTSVSHLLSSYMPSMAQHAGRRGRRRGHQDHRPR